MNFIESYLKMTKGTESPVEYHVWSMLSALSVCAGRRFHFRLGHLYYYPNLYVVLVGDPGMRKSTAMNFAKDIVRSSKITPMAATQESKQSISLEMSNEKYPGKRKFTLDGVEMEYNQRAIFATELTQFIGIDPLGMLDFLTTVWDEPVYEVKTKNKGNDYVIGPYITMLACMTPELVKGFLRQNLLTGGFARRTAFVFQSQRNIVPIPEFTAEQEEARRLCIEYAKSIQHRSGVFSMSNELKEFYIDWNHKNETSLRDRPPTTRGWFQSKAEMLWKVSMLVALAETDNPTLVLEVPHYKIALRFCDHVEKNLERVFEGAGINPNAAAASQICSMLEAMQKPMNRKVVESTFFGQTTGLSELRDTLDHLVSVGRLEQRSVTINGQLQGTVISAAGIIQNYSDEALAAFLVRPGVQPTESDAGPPQ